MENKNQYASKEKFGVHDILLTYVPGEKNADKQLTEEMLLPYIAYLEKGQIKDTLFDGFVFLPYVRFLYDVMEKRPLTKSHWLEYMENQFEPGRNVEALDGAFSKVNDALNLPTNKGKVYFSLFYPVKSVTHFGEINGKDLNFSDLEDRITAVKWMVDTQLEMFKEKGYKNLELGGFYWFTEELDYSDEGIIEIIKETTDYVRSLGLITSWIPYFRAKGYDDWEKLGFDLGCYQPNYAFNFEIPKTRLYDAYNEAKKLGMCAELEVGKFSPEDVDRMKDYFQVGAETGVMEEAVHMYYQDAGPGVFYDSYLSEDPHLHSLYEALYAFTKNKY